MSQSIHVRYFAALREGASKSEEIVETSAVSAKELYSELKEVYGFSLCPSQVRVSINEKYQDMSSRLSNHDQVVFIPPVAGG